MPQLTAGPSKQGGPSGLATEANEKLRIGTELHDELLQHLKRYQYNGFSETPRPHIPAGLVPGCANYIKSLNMQEKNGLKVLFVIGREHCAVDGIMVEAYFCPWDTKQEDFEPILQVEPEAMYLEDQEKTPPKRFRKRISLRLLYHDWVSIIHKSFRFYPL
jgi:hypothetical protein